MEVIELDTGKLFFFLTTMLLIQINVLLFMYLSTDFGSTFSGVLTDEQGRVQAIWGSFSTQVYTTYSLLIGTDLDIFNWDQDRRKC